jgi:hypothetical protein
MLLLSRSGGILATPAQTHINRLLRAKIGVLAVEFVVFERRIDVLVTFHIPPNRSLINYSILRADAGVRIRKTVWPCYVS